MLKLQTVAPLAGRILLGGVFLYSGVSKLGDVSGFAGYVEMGGLPGFLAWPAILAEIAIGLLLILGWQTRWAALAGALFCIATALLYHFNLAEPGQMVHFNKNLAIAGGFLAFFGMGPGAYAIDRR